MGVQILYLDLWEQFIPPHAVRAPSPHASTRIAGTPRAEVWTPISPHRRAFYACHFTVCVVCGRETALV